MSIPTTYCDSRAMATAVAHQISGQADHERPTYPDGLPRSQPPVATYASRPLPPHCRTLNHLSNQGITYGFPQPYSNSIPDHNNYEIMPQPSSQFGSYTPPMYFPGYGQQPFQIQSNVPARPRYCSTINPQSMSTMAEGLPPSSFHLDERPMLAEATSFDPLYQQPMDYSYSVCNQGPTEGWHESFATTASGLMDPSYQLESKLVPRNSNTYKDDDDNSNYDDDIKDIGPDTMVDSKEEPYAQLIFKALKEASGHQMILRDIYDWFHRNTDKAKDPTQKGWQNSIRHNLSMNGAFRKVDNPESSSGENNKKSYFWRLTEEALLEGVKSTTRYRTNKANKKQRSNAIGHATLQRHGHRNNNASNRTIRRSVRTNRDHRARGSNRNSPYTLSNPNSPIGPDPCSAPFSNTMGNSSAPYYWHQGVDEQNQLQMLHEQCQNVHIKEESHPYTMSGPICTPMAEADMWPGQRHFVPQQHQLDSQHHQQRSLSQHFNLQHGLPYTPPQDHHTPPSPPTPDFHYALAPRDGLGGVFESDSDEPHTPPSPGSMYQSAGMSINLDDFDIDGGVGC